MVQPTQTASCADVSAGRATRSLDGPLVIVPCAPAPWAPARHGPTAKGTSCRVGVSSGPESGGGQLHVGQRGNNSSRVEHAVSSMEICARRRCEQCRRTRWQRRTGSPDGGAPRRGSVVGVESRVPDAADAVCAMNKRPGGVRRVGLSGRCPQLKEAWSVTGAPGGTAEEGGRRTAAAAGKPFAPKCFRAKKLCQRTTTHDRYASPQYTNAITVEYCTST